MTDQEIHKYIDLLNDGNSKESIFLRPLGEHVDLARVWSELPKPDDDVNVSFFSYRFFFVRNESNEYVGGILDMKQDLHWYVVPKHRKQGHLTMALQQVVIPYLFDDRDSQKITIQRGTIGQVNYENSVGVAQHLGFVQCIPEPETYVLTKTKFNWDNVKISESDNPLEKERMEELKRRAHYAYKMLYKINDELEMVGLWDERLQDSVDKLRYFPMRLEDMIWDGR